MNSDGKIYAKTECCEETECCAGGVVSEAVVLCNASANQGVQAGQAVQAKSTQPQSVYAKLDEAKEAQRNRVIKREEILIPQDL